MASEKRTRLGAFFGRPCDFIGDGREHFIDGLIAAQARFGGAQPGREAMAVGAHAGGELGEQIRGVGEHGEGTLRAWECRGQWTDRWAGLEPLAMSDTLLKSALKMSKAQRILLAERLWDSVAEETGAPALTPEAEEELQRRLDRLEKTGPQGCPWGEVKKRVMRRRKARVIARRRKRGRGPLAAVGLPARGELI